MKHTLLKKTTMVILITFFSMIFVHDYSYSQPKSIELEEAKDLYKKGDFDTALEILNGFIDIIEKGNEKEIYKEQLSEAYYYKAKIYFTFKKNIKMEIAMEKALRNLFGVDPNYVFPPGEDADFIKKANEIKDRWQKEKEEQKKKVIEEERIRKKKRLTRLLIIVGVVVVGVVAAVLLKKKTTEKKFTLTVNAGEGVEGTPATGTYSYNQGETINYGYTLKAGYNTLTVKLDGNDVSPNGSIKMDKNHTLTASASKRYTLTVVKKNGVNGTPESGTYAYNEGATVTYNYSLQQGYKDLTVTIDGTSVSAAGTITMDRDHSLIAYSGKTYSLTVTKGAGVNGIPASGAFVYSEGEIVNYGYSIQSGYKDMVVTLDRIQVPASGTIAMDKDHTLTASATLIVQHTLTVSRGDGVNGTPATGTFTYNAGDTVTYNYTLQEGYQNLVVNLDGNPVSPSGTITMNMNHTLIVSATAVVQYTLTVSKSAGVIGEPNSGTFPYNNGQSVTYNYTLQDGYTNLVVTLDENTVASSGTITMDRNHNLTASATPITDQYTLTVTRNVGVEGTPETGTYRKEKGDTVNYEYSFSSGYTDLVVTLDGNKVSASGTITMNSDHILVATAKKQYTLTVTRGEGVDGYPNTGEAIFSDGHQEPYSYTLKSGYKNLVVKLDGNAVPASGNVTMNANHELKAIATSAAGYDEKK